jgi:hypothetical protein
MAAACDVSPRSAVRRTSKKTSERAVLRERTTGSLMDRAESKRVQTTYTSEHEDGAFLLVMALVPVTFIGIIVGLMIVTIH